MRIRLQQGVWTAVLGVGGAGAIMVAPHQLWIGWSLIAASALLLLWGVRINGRHWWTYLKKGGGALLNEPNVPLWHAIEYVARQIGDTNRMTCHPAAIKAIRQAAINEKIEVWGQREFDQGAQSGLSEVWTPIAAEYWRTHRINFAVFGGKPQAHSYGEPVTLPLPHDRYFALKVRQSEIEDLWPR